ncbi:hypothetical protein T05_9939 [Trichinella murrelli]|uniref:Uncharacterized protein n=1 Tax=Trichinella murrelli TaxID=144512 RepID=A0A0V0TET5_9BILA|nr:hypothetical protein T05_9939 [Trichinella murrelli]
MFVFNYKAFVVKEIKVDTGIVQEIFFRGRPRTDASVWLARTEQCLEQNGIPRDRGTSVACSFLSDDVYVQVMQLPLTVNERFAEFAKMFAERYSLVESTLDARAKFIFRRQLPG